MSFDVPGVQSASAAAVAILIHRLAMTTTAISGSLLLAACGGGSGNTAVTEASPAIVTVTPAPTATPTPMPTPASTSSQTLSTTPGFGLGINVASPMYYAGEPVFANLLTGSFWVDPQAGWSDMPASMVDRQGNVVLPSGRVANRMLTPPASVMSGQGTTIRCSWEGTGDASVSGAKSKDVRLDHGWEFYWPGSKGPGDNVWLEVRSSSASDPLRNFDCREKDVARSEVFGAEFVTSMKPYGVLRFMDWSNVNGNPTEATWSKRTLPDNLNQARAPLGVALEYMIALSNRVDADPWFNIPWNADEDYVRRMAQMVHDGIPGHRHVYVELSNEVWNYGFGVTAQAQREGLAEGLSTEPFKAVLYRYAEKTRWAMNIWKDVFKDRPGQLVRVAASQGGNPWTADVELGEAKLAPDVDALAIAPYFGADLISDNKGVTDTGVLLAALVKDRDRIAAGTTQQNVTAARKYGVRLIAYEAGQHILGDTGLMKAVNRSDAMYDIYKAYIADWKTRVNDTLVLFNSTSPITNWGAWGLREYAGQPLAETPKRRAAIEAGRRKVTRS